MERLNADLGIGKAKGAAVADEPEGDATTDPAAAVDGEPAPVEAVEPKAYSHKLAALQLEAQKSKSELLKAKDTATKATARVTELETTLAAIAKDPKAALKHSGMDPLAFAQALIDGKIELGDVTPKTERDPEVQALIDEGKAAREKAAREASEAQLAEVRTANLELVSQAIAVPAFAEKFPLVAATEGASEKMLAWIELEMERNGGVEPDFDVVAKAANDVLVGELVSYLKKDVALKAVLKDPEILAALKKEFGAAETSTAATTAPATKPPTKPTTLTSKVTNAVPSRTAKGTRADIIAKLNQDHGLGVNG